MIAKIKGFFNDVVKEMKKVSWPTTKQLKESTTVVVIFTIFFTIFVYLVDWIFSQALKLYF